MLKFLCQVLLRRLWSARGDKIAYLPSASVNFLKKFDQNLPLLLSFI
jgi:hypothetical protein